MQKLFWSFVFIVFSSHLVAQDLSPITLNKPDTGRGLPVMQAFQQRASVTAFSSAALSIQDLSDLLWAANGINRPDEKKRTAPSARNCQDVDVYVCMEAGMYLYDAVSHSLKPIAAGDYRHLVAGRQAAMANAPVFLILVSDISRFGGGEESANLRWAAMDSGIVSQNIAVACAGLGLVTRPRASMDTATLKDVMKLNESQHLMLNNPVGYSAE